MGALKQVLTPEESDVYRSRNEKKRTPLGVRCSASTTWKNVAAGPALNQKTAFPTDIARLKECETSNPAVTINIPLLWSESIHTAPSGAVV